MTTKTTIKPVKIESRICFGIAYFNSPEDAVAWAKDHPGTYNGGFFDGSPTGRDSTWDKPEEGLYAATY